MKQKLLYFILPLMFFAVTLQAQDKVWDFGNDSTNWPIDTAGLQDTAIVKDNLGMYGVGSTNFGIIEASGTTFATDGFTASNRFKMNGDSGISGNMPSKRYLFLDVNGDITIKVWARTGGGGTRTLFISDGDSNVGSLAGPASGEHLILSYSYTGPATRLYIYNDASCNLYKIEASPASALGTTTLSIDSKASPVSTNVHASGNRIYVSGVKTSSEINIYSITGALVKSFKTDEDMDFAFRTGFFIATIKTSEGEKSVKLVTN